LIKKFLPGKLRRILRNIIYNKWVEDIFYPRGYRAKINGESINIPFRFSRFYPVVYEEEKTVFIKKHCGPGNIAIDIGAHIGVFSFFLARQVGKEGKVYSFEPAPFTFKILQKTIKFNGLENIVDARQQVVSNTHSDVTFYIYKSSSISNANSISVQNNPGIHVKPIRVAAVVLDDFMSDVNFKNLSFIKIDAEGAELEILKGGARLIAKYRPFMTLEVHPKNFEDPVKTQTEIFDLLKNFGYGIYRDNRQMDVREFCSLSDYFEVFLIPSSNTGTTL
jgi:FkbM family methyltransferase